MSLCHHDAWRCVTAICMAAEGLERAVVAAEGGREDQVLERDDPVPHQRLVDRDLQARSRGSRSRGRAVARSRGRAVARSRGFVQDSR